MRSPHIPYTIRKKSVTVEDERLMRVGLKDRPFLCPWPVLHGEMLVPGKVSPEVTAA